MLPTNSLFLSYSQDWIIVILFLLVSLTTNWTNFSAYKIMLPALSSVSPCMRVQHQCLKHSTGFQWKPGSNTKLLACVFSVYVTTLCHLIFLTFFIHTYHLGRCVLSTPLCLQFLASVSRPMAEDLSLSLAPLSGTPYLYLSGKLSVFHLSKRS